MNEERRGFIKKTGAGILAGIGAASGLFLHIPMEQTDASVFSDRKSTGTTRWGMLIDMRTCREGCQKCVDACHKSHNVPDFGHSRHEIKWIEKSPYSTLFPTAPQEFADKERGSRTLPSLCNHCAEPPCVRSCPTEAVFKRNDGIVAFDYHRCIGCRSCMASCPYGAVSFNWREPRPALKAISESYPTREMGVAEKCNFCSERLLKGALPACVEACPEKTLIFGDLNDPESGIRKLLASNQTMQRKPELGTLPSVFYII